MTTPDEKQAKEFAEAADQKSVGLIKEFVGFLRENKKWWLLPIVLVLLVMGVFIFLSGSAVAPFIYTLF